MWFRRIAACRICGNQHRLRCLKNWISISMLEPMQTPAKANPHLSKVLNRGNTMPEPHRQARGKSLLKVEIATGEVIEAAVVVVVGVVMAEGMPGAIIEMTGGIALASRKRRGL